MQVAGHLRGQVLQEWKLLDGSAIRGIRECLDPGDQTLAALGFRHAALTEYFRQLFGHEKLFTETRDYTMNSNMLYYLNHKISVLTIT